MKIRLLGLLVSFLYVAHLSFAQQGEEPASNALVKVYSKIGFANLVFSGREAAEAFNQMKVNSTCHLMGTVKVLVKDGENVSCIRMADTMSPVQYQCSMAIDLQSGTVTASHWLSKNVGLETLPIESVDARLCE